MNTQPTPETGQWETYCDECYYHMWRLRRKTEIGWHDGVHINTEDEAKGLCDLLNNLERELTAVTEQRDSLHELHNKNAARSKELLELCGTLREQRDRLAEVIEAASFLIAAKGRHNTMLAYNGLRDALQSLTTNEKP